MNSKTFSFPHISRLFSATHFETANYLLPKILYWSLFIFLIEINVSSRTYIRSNLNSPIRQLAQSPLSPINHKHVATYYWNEGYTNKAMEEMTLAQSLITINAPSVLGEQTTANDILNTWKQQPKLLSSTYQFWIDVVKQKPDYRDAYLQAAEAVYSLGNKIEARQLIEKAEKIDPNFEATIRFISLINSSK